MNCRILHLIVPFLIVCTLLTCSTITFACQCQGGINKFLYKLKKSDFVGYVEVIGYDTLKDHDFDATFTKLKVIQQFQGKIPRQCIEVLDGGDVNCTHSLHYPLGTRFIIKGHFQRRKEYEFNWEEAPLPTAVSEVKDPILVLSICTESIINIEDGKAIGYISQDRRKSKKPQNYDIDEAITLIRRRAKKHYH